MNSVNFVYRIMKLQLIQLLWMNFNHCGGSAMTTTVSSCIFYLQSEYSGNDNR